MKDHDPDQLTDSKTMYDVSPGEIFWRNLIAGAGRGIGGLIFQAIFLLILVNLFVMYVWPVLEPLFKTVDTTNQALEQLQKANQNLPLFQWGE
jgi:hypothetical protein